MAPRKKPAGIAAFEKSVNSLLGIIEGITIDGEVNETEVQFLQTWIEDHRIKTRVHPFSELIPVVAQAIADKVLTSDEVEDIKWLCNKLTSRQYFKGFAADIQKLHALMGAVGADGVITEKELEGLGEWMQEHSHLENEWPYDEVLSAINRVMQDKKIDADEHKELMQLFGEFVSILDNKTIVNPAVKESSSLANLCDQNPKIKFPAVFCLTGECEKYSREAFKKLIRSLGGKYQESFSEDVDYLIVGANGSEDWAFACYGRKIEAAVHLKKRGHHISIVHEHDFEKASAGESVKERAKSLAENTGTFVSSEIELLPELIKTSETLLGLAKAGKKGTGAGLLCATNRRVLFVYKGMFNKTVEEFDFKSLSSISADCGWMMAVIKIISQAGVVEFHTSKKEAKNFVDVVKSQIAKLGDGPVQKKTLELNDEVPWRKETSKSQKKTEDNTNSKDARNGCLVLIVAILLVAWCSAP